MVLKKTNCHNVNSGNTLRKRGFRELFQKKVSQTNHALRIVCNVTDNNRKDEIVDAAKYYFEDGLSLTSGYFHTFFNSVLVSHTMNKKKRWLLEESIAEAVRDVELAEEPFKVTLVHRAVPLEYGRIMNSYHNVEAYYDSHISSYPIKPNSQYSSRQDLIERGKKIWRDQEVPMKSQSRKKLGHNKHFRGTQRKQTWGPFVKTENAENADPRTPEVRYEIAVPWKLNSKDLNCTKGLYKDYWYKPYYPTFRGHWKERSDWYDVNTSWKRGSSRLVLAKCDSAYFEEDEDLETTSDCEDYSLPAVKEFSLLDLAAATQKKRSLVSKERGKVNKRKSNTSPVNSASHQQIHKYGKKSAIFIQKEEEVKLANDELTASQAVEATQAAETEAEAEIDDPNRQQVESPLSSFDYEAEFIEFEKSFCSGRFLQSEFSARFLHDTLGSAVEFGNCIPFTARFNLQAASLLLDNSNMDAFVDEWWLLCQVGEKVKDQFSSILHSKEDVINLNMKLCNSYNNTAAKTANLQLQEVVKDPGQHGLFLSITTLLLHVCRILQAQFVCNQLDLPTVQVPKTLDVHLPYEPYVSNVTACNITQAYHHLKAAGKVSPIQVTQDEDLDILSSLTWCDLECVICFNRFDEDDTVTERVLCPFVVISTCGHCFCLQCWQHHLVHKILEGQTSLNCMEYKCDVVLDMTTLMTMIPQWVLARWQHLVQSRAVESSGVWNWCPNARCNLLASTQASRKDLKGSGNSMGVPVICKCQKRWCLDCGKDAHWPVSCRQLATYTKMLRQYGDEHGYQISREIYHVRVKRCPGCRYPIEKSAGCSHMTCPCCHQHFCWECLVDWNEHVRQWVRCNIREEEVVELNNEKCYPLPIQCYQKAVSFRYKRNKMRGTQHISITAYHATYAFLKRLKGKRAVANLSEHTVSYIVDAIQFVEKALTLLELSYILLSNIKRSQHCLEKPLCTQLQQLEFTCERLYEHLKLPKKKVLSMAEKLHRISSTGHHLIGRICYHCHLLAPQIHSKNVQEWILTTDHERFVRYK